jgi:hypothetical protein
MFKKGWSFGVIAMLMGVLAPNTYAQFTIQHQQPTSFVRGEANPLEFIVSGINQNEIQEAILYYRYDDDISYQQQEVFYRQGTFTANFQVNNSSASSVEYYFKVFLNSGAEVTYPERDPEESPTRIEVVNQTETKGIATERIESIDYTVLSPNQGDVIANNDVVIAIAMYYEEADLEEGVFRLYIDRLDVTDKADTSNYFISYVPKGLANGPHSYTLTYETASKKYLVVSQEFQVVDISRAEFVGFEERNKPVGRLELGARSQTIAGNPNDAYTARTNISGQAGLFRYSLNGFFTSQESNRLQPQNRYGADLQFGKWVRLQAGHVYPNMGRFTISGRRVYGINSELHLLNENFNVQFIYGELNRKIKNLYTGVLIEEEAVGSGAVVDTSYTLQYDNLGKGTFSRKVIGGRVAFGKSEKVQLGIQAMKVEDDTTSLFNVRDYFDLLNGPSSLYQNVQSDPNHVNKLQNNPDFLQIQSGSVNPKGNFVSGADLKIGLASNRIQLKNETVISALNNDIYGGPLTVERADELGFEIEEDIEDILGAISRFIIVNENMNILPLRIKDIDSDSADAEPFFPTSVIASRSEFSINYPSNNFKLQYRWIGPNFSSLANSTIRKDVAGYTISDRFRMFQNRVYVTLGYESLEDNVTNDKAATTESNTYRTNVSWYPVDKKLPRINLGLRYRTRENGVVRFNPEVPSQFEKAAVQNFSIDGTDTLLTTVPKESITLNLTSSITQQFLLWDMIHDASLSISNLKTTDEVFAYGDVRSSAVSFNITSRFENIRLRTQLGVTVNNTETGSGQTNIDIFGMYAGGSYFVLDGKLNLNARLAITSNTSKTRAIIVDPTSAADDDTKNDYFVLSPTSTTSDFGTFVLQTGAQYEINDYHSLRFDANFTNVSGAGNANDSIVALRYLFNF